MKSKLPLILTLLLFLALCLASLKYCVSPPEDDSNSSSPSTSQLEARPPPPSLADLGTQPDWSRLDDYQESIPKSAFVHLLNKVYVWNNNVHWEELISVGEESCFIRMENEAGKNAHYELRFAPSQSPAVTPPRYWRPLAEIPPASKKQPLAGLNIAIDPGHIGGDFAQMEERYFSIDSSSPVMEGEMTLAVAKLIAPALEELGAKVTLVRSENAPVTEQRPKDFARATEELFAVRGQPPVPDAMRRTAEKLFYRTAEIRARATKVNETIKPDFVLCLHFNAEAWGDPSDPSLTPNNHLHMILHGSYMDGEIAHDDERFQMIYKLLQRIHGEEKNLNAAVVKEFAKQSGLPAYRYATRKPAMNIDDNPFLWARNLLANRLYECPVIYVEPYVMNSQEVFDRVQLGDYEGLKEIHGQERKSIYREYADSVVTGLKNYYLENRSLRQK